MKKKLCILIVEDSIIFSQGLELILKHNSKVGKIKIAHDLNNTLHILKTHLIDLIFLDLNFENDDFDGFSIAKKVKQLYPQIKIIVLTQHARIYIHEKLFNECGVDAYLDKQSGAKETFMAIDQVMTGKIYVDPNISKILEIEQWMKLSKREGEVMPLLIKGLTQKEIARILYISPRTVEQHINNLLKRFNVKNSVELVTKYLTYINRNREDYHGGLPLT